MTTPSNPEPRGTQGQRAAYCSCGAFFFSSGHFRNQHFARDGHDRITWRQFRELHPDIARLTGSAQP